MSRKYQPIWEKIKIQGSCSIRVLPVGAKTTKKGVQKEKEKDRAFKLLNEHDHFYLRIDYDSETCVMKFTLKQTAGIEERILA